MHPLCKNYAPDSPFIYSIPEAFKDISDLYRSNVIGGLVNAYRRHVSTFDQPHIPSAARFAPNGQPFSTIISLDFTSMYLACQREGDILVRGSNIFRKYIY